MEKAVERLNNNAERLGEMGDELDIKMSAMLVQFDTLVALHKDERVEFEKMHHESMERLTKHYKHIIIGLIATIFLIIGSLVAGAVYLFTNYEIYSGTYQDVSSDNSSSVTIHDGIHVNDN